LLNLFLQTEGFKLFKIALGNPVSLADVGMKYKDASPVKQTGKLIKWTA